MAHKKRLDQLVQELFPHYSRNLIQSWIMQGKIKVNGQVITKPGVAIPIDATINAHIEEPKYVGRAGFKLEKALDYFGISVAGLTALDAGLSTGGFTDCLLQRGAKKIYGVDVGYGQVHEKIRGNPAVVVMERTNLRELPPLDDHIDMVTLDLSFISVLKVMDVVASLLADRGQLVVLIKPQFEARKEDVERGGLIRNVHIHRQVIEKVTRGIESFGFELVGVTDSPIAGTTGNKEFLAYFVKSSAQGTAN
jgi:23S rRNA (cytidine1920-2'-O)/16S rRNA (cytidine1409-2'-O)-methyltransferase